VIKYIALTLTLMLIAATGANAIVDDDGTGGAPGNDSVTTSDLTPASGWFEHSGIYRAASYPSTIDHSATYLRNGWIATANHSGVRSVIILDGVSYSTIAGTSVSWIAESPNRDLLIVKVREPYPPITDLAIASARPIATDLFYFIGAGLTRGGSTGSGWNIVQPHVYRWGTNHFTNINASEYTYTFDDLATPGPVPAGEFEGIGTGGDSGGGIFTGLGAATRIVGVNVVGIGSPAIFGTSQGAIVDMVLIKAAIDAIVDVANCNNGIDDDGDGLTDYPDDTDCADANGTSERAHQAPGGWVATGATFVGLYTTAAASPSDSDWGSGVWGVSEWGQ
jgi:hypothetical protein